MKAKKPKFKNRYVLAEGYPMPIGDVSKPYTMIVMWEENMSSSRIPLNVPQDIFSNELPKYRLILERVNP